MTLATIDTPVEFVLLDGWKNLYLPVLHLLEPRLTPGALVIADDTISLAAEMGNYLWLRPGPGQRLPLRPVPRRRRPGNNLPRLTTRSGLGYVRAKRFSAVIM